MYVIFFGFSKSLKKPFVKIKVFPIFFLIGIFYFILIHNFFLKNPSFKIKFDIILMLKGDEPMVSPPMMEKLLSNFIKSRANVANLICKMSKKKEIMDQNEIKVVKDKFNNAIYYSRNVIPHNVKKVLNQHITNKFALSLF